jgi:hypothetical protein
MQQHEIAGSSIELLRFRAESSLGNFIMWLHKYSVTQILMGNVYAI